jgi:mRNA interferase MazF
MVHVKRGDIVVVAPGQEAPRPALVVQSDLFDKGHPSVTLAPITRTIVNAPLFRLTVEALPGNGLGAVSQIMIDKLTTVRRDVLAETIGHFDEEIMVRVGRALALWTGIGS